MMSENENMKELKENEVEGVTGGKKPVTRICTAADDKEAGRNPYSRNNDESADNKGAVANPLPFPQDRR